MNTFCIQYIYESRAPACTQLEKYSYTLYIQHPPTRQKGTEYRCMSF